MLVLVIELSEVIVDSFLSQSDETRNALSVEDGTMQLDEIGAILNNLDYLSDLFQAAFVAVLHIWYKEVEQILAHFVVDDCLARDLLLRDSEFVEDSQTEAERESDATDLVQFVVFSLKEEGS